MPRGYIGLDSESTPSTSPSRYSPPAYPPTILLRVVRQVFSSPLLPHLFHPDKRSHPIPDPPNLHHLLVLLLVQSRPYSGIPIHQCHPTLPPPQCIPVHPSF